MCIPWKKQIAEALLLLCLPLVAAGCGGGGGGASAHLRDRQGWSTRLA